MRRGLPWTDDEDRRLRELARAGLSYVEIALEMRRSTSMVRRHAEKLKIKVANGRKGTTAAMNARR